MKKWLSFIVALCITVPAMAWDFGAGAVFVDGTDLTDDRMGVEVFARKSLGDQFANKAIQFNLGTVEADLESDDSGELETNWIEASLLHVDTLGEGIWYVGAGIGWYWYDLSIPDDIETLAEHFGLGVDADVGDEWGYFVRGGATVPLNDTFSLIFDVKYLWIEVDLDGSVSLPGVGVLATIDEEGDLDGFSATVGGSIAFG